MTQRKRGIVFSGNQSFGRIDSIQPGGPQYADFSIQTTEYELPSDSKVLWEWNKSDVSQFDQGTAIMYTGSTTGTPVNNGVALTAVAMDSINVIDGIILNDNLSRQKALRVSGSVVRAGVLFNISDINLSGTNRFVVEVEIFSASTVNNAAFSIGLCHDTSTAITYGLTFNTSNDNANHPSLGTIDDSELLGVDALLNSSTYLNSTTPSSGIFTTTIEVALKPAGTNANTEWNVRGIGFRPNAWGTRMHTGNSVFPAPTNWTSKEFNNVAVGMLNVDASVGSIDFYITKLRILKHWKDL